jgi:signal peptidase I
MIRKTLVTVLGPLLVMVSACSAAKKVAVQPVRVLGVAMEPAFKDGDRIFITRLPDPIERGDIVIFYNPIDPSTSYIKRVIGLPHDRVEIREGRIFINGETLTEPYVDIKNNQAHRSAPEIKMPAENYYVIGDNRDNSADSRIWGPLQRRSTYGKYVSKYYSAD